MKKLIITICGIAIVVILSIVALSMYFSYNNQEIALREKAEAQRVKIEANFDAMWKTISQKADVTAEYRDAFKDVYVSMMDSRYSGDDGTLLKFIKESNPTFDSRLYLELSQTIEIERKSFANDQAYMSDIIREHRALCKSFPARFFISDKSPIEFTVVSSSKTKAAMETGIDDDVDLFGKSNGK